MQAPPSLDLATRPAQRLDTRYTQDPTAAPVFNGMLDRAYSEGMGEEAQLREAAEKLVSTTLIMPMFERLRNDPLAVNLMHGGRGEKIFQQQMDQILSDRIASASNFDLVDSVYKQLNSAIKGEAINTNG
ncbi:MAG: rod-binding protein [Planctomycetota bacterium]